MDVCALSSWDRCRSCLVEGHGGDESVPQELLQSPFEEPGPTPEQAEEGAPGYGESSTSSMYVPLSAEPLPLLGILPAGVA